MKIQSLYRYPLKGFSPEFLESIDLDNGKGFRFDRYWALEIGEQEFDHHNPSYLKKGRFIQLLSHPKLALLKCKFNCEEQKLTIDSQEQQLGHFDLSNPSDKTKLEQVLIEYIDDANITTLNLGSAPQHHFSDIPQAAVSLINLASVRDLAKTMGSTIDPLRFRANIYVEGLDPWQELDWAGKSIWANGEKIFDVFEDIGRCLATHVNLETGERDLKIKNKLLETYNHSKCGVYVVSTSATKITTGMQLTIK